MRDKEKRQQMQMANAVSSWEDKKKGIYRNYEKERFSTEYCEEQIQYFKNLKL